MQGFLSASIELKESDNYESGSEVTPELWVLGTELDLHYPSSAQ